jgi:hypothetical protein
MSREDFVSVRATGGGAAAISAGSRALVLAAGETASSWADGSPITRGEFDDVLEREGAFEIAEAPRTGRQDAGATKSAQPRVAAPPKQEE